MIVQIETGRNRTKAKAALHEHLAELFVSMPI